jgi:hypothetical protein
MGHAHSDVAIHQVSVDHIDEAHVRSFAGFVNAQGFKGHGRPPT